MRIIGLFTLILIGLLGAAFHNVSAQNDQRAQISAEVRQEQRNLANAKKRNEEALSRSNILRNQANEARGAAMRFDLQKNAINADIEAARANLDAARARIAIITQRQSMQQRQLARETSPILRLMGALENMTRRPATLMVMQPQSLNDYVHLRAVMASVQPKIAEQTAGLRGQIDLQKSLRNQQKIALASLEQAQGELDEQQKILAQLEAGSEDVLNADNALEFERAIAAGERARAIVDNIDNIQQDDEALAALSVLGGPKLREGGAAAPIDRNNDRAYLIPDNVQIRSGFGELNETGYRERGVRMSLAPASDIFAPADGVISYAGIYRNFGQIVIIEHGGGWTSLITNMAALNVKKGQSVDQETVIGIAKNNDNDILIELRRNGRPMDIMAMVLQ